MAATGGEEEEKSVMAVARATGRATYITEALLVMMEDERTGMKRGKTCHFAERCSFCGNQDGNACKCLGTHTGTHTLTLTHTGTRRNRGTWYTVKQRYKAHVTWQPGGLVL